jgi:Holliday junction resolvasome RuvABC ATP-dependent DNA helicase subunit
MKRLEDDKGKFVCIAAGYHYEMNRFLNANPGLKRRFNHTWHIEDYSAGELEVIFRAMAKKRGYNLSDDLDKSLLPFVETLVQNKTKNFGNAGDIFNIVQKTISTQATRLTALGRKPTKEELFMLFAADLPLNAGQMQKKVSVDEALAKLNALIGLDCVKDQISNISSLMEVAKIRQSLGGAESSKGFHFVFTGNPGTGKTTVARILGEVLAALGVLSSGHVVEVDRSKLVGTHIGHSEEITQKKVEEAMGGVLFVDEAYSLVGEGNDFGQKVIDTLLKLMEDHRGKFVVIAAGYRQDMDRFLNSNEGLRSRFTNFVDFEDYGPSEMAQIFRFFCDNARLQYDVTAERKTLELMTTLCTNKKPGFANGRTARNIFEKTMLKQAKRIQRIPEFPNLSNSILSSFEPEDIPGPEDL